jgi:steroid 5-alpha reductase family enzyme
MNWMIGTIFFLVILYFFSGWIVSRQSGKFAWIDFFWASSFLLIVGLVFTLTSLEADLGLSILSTPLMILGGMYIIWSLRLSYLLILRIPNHDEDPRYVNLKKEWGTQAYAKLFLMYMFEGLLALILALPLFMKAWAQPQEFHLWNLLGVSLFVIALAGESLSDFQLNRFKSSRKKPDEVCTDGLWKYSRHPNYFFELLIWLSYGVFNLSLANPVASFVPFLIMTFMLTKVTGIPYAEKQSLQRSGNNYRRYQRRTSPLIPWFPRKEMD